VSYTDRIWVAWRISRDIETCERLLRGETVDEERLDPRGLAWAAMMRFARLDTAGIDLFFEEGRASVEKGARL
jgi:hypothetical protein